MFIALETVLRPESECVLHGSLNTWKGVVRCFDLQRVSEEEIFKNMKEQGVINIRRIKV